MDELHEDLSWIWRIMCKEFLRQENRDILILFIYIYSRLTLHDKSLGQ
jgi:hypothetical protein